MGVGKALHRAEQKQRRTEPSQHTEHRRDAAGELEEIMNVVQHHQHQCNGLELGAVQPFFRQFIHTESPFLLCIQCNRKICRKYKVLPLSIRFCLL